MSISRASATRLGQACFHVSEDGVDFENLGANISVLYNGDHLDHSGIVRTGSQRVRITPGQKVIFQLWRYRYVLLV